MFHIGAEPRDKHWDPVDDGVFTIAMRIGTLNDPFQNMTRVLANDPSDAQPVFRFRLTTRRANRTDALEKF